MVRFALFCLIGLMITDAKMEPIIGMDESDKKKKRREQNVKAAKKSYEAKKLEREDLKKKNTELVETQMRLLHDKSRLQEHIKLLEYAVESLQHSCSKNLHSKYDVYDSRVQSFPVPAPSPKSLRRYESKGSPLTEKSYNICDEHIIDTSSLGIGATQEVVYEMSEPAGKEKYPIIGGSAKVGPELEEDAFIPKQKKPKLYKQVSFSPRGCSTDVLRKQRGSDPASRTRGRISTYE